MTPQELRNSILQRAIEGKLVEQRAEEGTGEELYKIIQEEKKKLIKEGKIKKQKTLDEIKEEEIPFDIPKNWKLVRLGKVANITAGGTPSRTNPQYWDGDIPWVKIADMNSKYISKTTETISKKGLDNSSAKIFSKGTLLYSIFASIGTVGILKIDASTNQAITGINFYGSIDIDYMYYVMLGLKSVLLCKARGMAQLNINQTILRNTIMPLPPLAEQKRIVDKIEELMPLVDEYEKNWQRLNDLNKKFPEDMKKSLLQEAIKGKLVEQRAEEGTGEELYKLIQEEKKRLIKEGKIKKQKALDEIKEEEIPFDIPKNWKWVRVGTIFQHNTGKALNQQNREGRELEYITTSNLYWDRFELDNLKKMFFKETELEKYSVSKGDLLVCEGGDVGRAAIWENEFGVMIQNHIHRLRAYHTVCTRYFYYLFCFYKSTNLIGGKGIGIKGLSSRVLSYILFPLPPLAEQKRIVEKLEELLPLCDELIKKEK